MKTVKNRKKKKKSFFMVYIHHANITKWINRSVSLAYIKLFDLREIFMGSIKQFNEPQITKSEVAYI